MAVCINLGAAIFKKSPNRLKLRQHGIHILRNNSLSSAVKRRSDSIVIRMKYEYGKNIAEDHASDNEKNSANYQQAL